MERSLLLEELKVNCRGLRIVQSSEIRFFGRLCERALPKVHHVVNRGGRREPIFRDDEDRWRFLTTLGEACGETDSKHRPAARSRDLHNHWFPLKNVRPTCHSK